MSKLTVRRRARSGNVHMIWLVAVVMLMSSLAAIARSATTDMREQLTERVQRCESAKRGLEDALRDCRAARGATIIAPSKRGPVSIVVKCLRDDIQVDSVEEVVIE